MATTAQDRLWEIAAEQHGYFTATDALAADVTRKALDHLVERHQVERAAFGVYQFPKFPTTPQCPYQLAVLWTGTPLACLSHETALESFGVSDAIPDRIHLTVPASRRIRRAGAGAYCVHRQDLAPEQVGWWEGIPTVTLPTAIEQCITWGTPTYLLRQAIEQSRRTGALLTDEAQDLMSELEARGE